MSDIIERIALRFTSGNDVSIERAHITAEEWEELRRDAGRYRWLRDSDATTGPAVFQTDFLGFPAELLEGDQLDAAIDSARGVEKTECGAG